MSPSRQWYTVSPPSPPTPTSLPQPLTLHAPPNTDIWRPSLTEDRFNAPYIYTALPSSTFHSLSVTISGPWKTQYDQGGLIILWPAKEQKHSKWLKIGIEHFTGKPMVGVVGCDRFSDWSVCPMPEDGGVKARFEAVRDGTTLWVYVLGEDGERRPLREVKWAFLEAREGDAEMHVGVYAAKPTLEKDDADKGIEVEFHDLQLQTS